MVKINLQDFKPVQVEANGLVLKSGGHLPRDYPLHTTDVKLEGRSGVATFVLITSEYNWLSYAVMGTRKPGRNWQKQGVLKDLRDKVDSAELRVRLECECVSQKWCPPGDKGVDPMNEMAVETPAVLTTREQLRKLRLNQWRKRFTKQVCRIAMKEWPPEMTPDSPNIERMVSVYLKGNSRINSRIWLHQDDLPWLIRSLYIQEKVKRVAVVPSDDKGPDAHGSMEDPVTPEKCRQPPKCEGNVHDKGSTAP